MCKLGDIIVVNEFKNEVGEMVKRHSFVVINDERNSIEGMNYDFVSNMLCSFHNEEHKKRKLQFKENLEITENSVSGDNANTQSGFAKCDQLYYFDKSLVDYYVLGQLSPALLSELLKLILSLRSDGKLKHITTNLKQTI